jgi:DNA-binding transcriptional LysR family regulator
MRWRFDEIVTFLHVVEAGSITAAAERLNISKSVVSKRISDLEDALGAGLFNVVRACKAAVIYGLPVIH